MSKRMAVAVVMILVLSGLATTAAGAAPLGQDRGHLTAHGDGVAALGGKGVVDVTGNGILWVHDLAGDATIDVSGFGSKEVFPDGWIQYAGFHGTGRIAGSRIRVGLAGTDINLEATGRGDAWLWGHGSYEAGPRSGSWATTDRGSLATF